jgi:hypothetical protein
MEGRGFELLTSCMPCDEGELPQVIEQQSRTRTSVELTGAHCTHRMHGINRIPCQFAPRDSVLRLDASKC